MDIESILKELTSTQLTDENALISNLEPQNFNSYLQSSDQVPDNVRFLLENAVGNQGVVDFNVNSLLYEDEDGGNGGDEEALDEIELHLGPDANDKVFEDQVPNFRKKRRRRRGKIAKAYSALSQELNDIMVKANMLYIQGNDEEAILALRKVIQERPDTHEAW